MSSYDPPLDLCPVDNDWPQDSPAVQSEPNQGFRCEEMNPVENVSVRVPGCDSVSLAASGAHFDEVKVECGQCKYSR